MVKIGTCRGALLAVLLAAGTVVRADDAPPAVAAPATLETAAGPGWSLRLPPGDSVVYRGQVSFDQAGTKGQAMLYPGGLNALGLVGLLAGVATHAIVESSIRSGQKSKLQEQADLVLLPYHDVLSAYNEQDLYAHTVPYMHAGGGKEVVPSTREMSNARMVITDPVFSMTQDQSAIVLDAAVTIYDVGAHGEDAKPAYQNSVRVFSAPRGEADLAAYWNANGGQALKDQSARLFARGLDLAIADMATQSNGSAPAAVAYKSIHYAEGRTDKVERGQPIAEMEDGTVLRNLRGWIMFVPPRPPPLPAAPVPVPPAVPSATPVSAPVPAVAPAPPVLAVPAT